MTAKNRLIHFIAQDRGSIKALLPLFALCSSWPATTARFFATRTGLDLLQARGFNGSEFPAAGAYPAAGDTPDLLVVGASMWESIEKRASASARAKGIPTLAIVDLGSNFWGRFTASGEPDLAALPELILAPDEEGREGMLLAGFPPERIGVSGNPAFDAYRPDATRGGPRQRRSILFVMQPERRDGSYRSDEAWLPLIIEAAAEFAGAADVVVRPHPKEDAAVYRPLAETGIVVDAASDISDLIGQSAIVIGKNSTALIEAVFRGKAVASLVLVGQEVEPPPTVRLGLSSVVRSAAELRRWIGAELACGDDARKLEKIRYYNDGKNTQRAAACVRDMLDRAATAGAPEPPPRRNTDG
jgi:hypothetical protein